MKRSISLPLRSTFNHKNRPESSKASLGTTSYYTHAELGIGEINGIAFTRRAKKIL